METSEYDLPRTLYANVIFQSPWHKEPRAGLGGTVNLAPVIDRLVELNPGARDFDPSRIQTQAIGMEVIPGDEEIFEIQLANTDLRRYLADFHGIELR